MTDAFIFDAVRTPRGLGRPNGSLHTLSPIDLGAAVLTALKDRTGFDRMEVDDVVFGVGDGVDDQGANMGRSALLHAGLPETISGATVSRFCASGLDAATVSAAKVMAGQADLVVAGGVEMMSLVQIGGTGGPFGSDAAFNTKVNLTPLGIAADLIATLDGHSREQVDAVAVESQARAARAWDEGRFDRSVIPVHDFNGELMLDRDEHPRPGTTMEALAKLKPAFAEFAAKSGFSEVVKARYPQVDGLNHVHTGGNSSGVVDGAAGAVIGSQAAADRLGLKPRAKVVSFATVGCDPCLALTAPGAAARKALARAGLDFDDIDLIECNEAFASVVLRFLSETGVSADKVNVNGGAIALGHPIGATGLMLLGTALDELERTEKRRALVTMCVGVGMGAAAVIERV